MMTQHNGETYRLEVYQPSPTEPVYVQLSRLSSYLFDASLIWCEPFDTQEQAQDHYDTIDNEQDVHVLIDLFDETVPARISHVRL
jgi:hypothetical protein